MDVAVNIVPGNLAVAGNPITFSISIINNFLAEVQTHNYPTSWSLDDINKIFHGPAFVSPVFVSHDETYQMWNEGHRATKGIGRASMYGASPGSKFFREIQKAGTADAIGQVVTGKNFVAEEEDANNDFVYDSGQIVTDALTLDENHTYISAFFKISPSPCWFSGFHDVEPVTDEGMWYDSFTVPVYPHTSNWATGSDYLDFLDREELYPHGDITRFTVETVPNDTKVFLNEEETNVPPVAYVNFNRRTEVVAEVAEVNETTDKADEGGTWWTAGRIAGIVIAAVTVLALAWAIVSFNVIKRSRGGYRVVDEQTTLVT